MLVKYLKMSNLILQDGTNAADPARFKDYLAAKLGIGNPYKN